MVFEHTETGIKILVHESVEQIRYQMSDGTGGYVDGKKEISTAAGQPCIPASLDDTRELQSIYVLTHKGKIPLVRIR